MRLSGSRIGSMASFRRLAPALFCGLIVMLLAWQSVTISPVAAQEETPSPTQTLTPTPTATPGPSVEEVFTLGTGKAFVIEHTVSWGEITIMAVLLILIYIVRFAGEKKSSRKD